MVPLKPQPNYRNISAQYIPTLLAQHLQVSAKRTQPFNATHRNIVGRNMLSAFGQLLRRVGYCWKIELLRMPKRNTVVRTRQNEYNIKQHSQMLHEKLDHFQMSADNTQHVATGWPSAPNMLRPKMLRFVTLAWSLGEQQN